MTDVAIPEKPDVVIIPFHGEDIYGLNVNGELEIILKPIVDRLGLDYWAQIQKLRKRSWAALASRQVQVPGQPQRREMLTCDVQTFLMMLATVDENKVSEDIKPKLVMYQAECAKAIEAYWTKGTAVNPRAEEPKTPAEMLLYHAQVALNHERKIKALEGKVTEIGARMDGIEQRTGWYTALAFAKLNGLPTDTPSLQRLGIAAKRVCLGRGINPVKINSSVYATVNIYPQECLAEAAGLVTYA